MTVGLHLHVSLGLVYCTCAYIIPATPLSDMISFVDGLCFLYRSHVSIHSVLLALIDFSGEHEHLNDLSQIRFTVSDEPIAWSRAVPGTGSHSRRRAGRELTPVGRWW
jgi:hypothetical protein